MTEEVDVGGGGGGGGEWGGGWQGDGEGKGRTEEQQVGNTAISTRFGSFLIVMALTPRTLPGT